MKTPVRVIGGASLILIGVALIAVRAWVLNDWAAVTGRSDPREILRHPKG